MTTLTASQLSRSSSTPTGAAHVAAQERPRSAGVPRPVPAGCRACADPGAVQSRIRGRSARPRRSARHGRCQPARCPAGQSPLGPSGQRGRRRGQNAKAHQPGGCPLGPGISKQVQVHGHEPGSEGHIGQDAVQGYSGSVAVGKPRIRGFSTRRPARGSATETAGSRASSCSIRRINRRPAPAASVLPQVKSLQLQPVRAKTPKFLAPCQRVRSAASLGTKSACGVRIRGLAGADVLGLAHGSSIPFAGNSPAVHPSAFVAPTASIIGKATLAEDSSAFYGVSVRADTAAITVGAGSNLQDNVVLHADPDSPAPWGQESAWGTPRLSMVARWRTTA